MQKQPFFPLFLGDLLTSCSEWPGESVSLYSMLLAHQWFSPQHSIPSDPDSVRALLRWDSTTFDRHWPRVARKFVEVNVDDEVRLQNRRCEMHRNKHLEFVAGQAEAGRKGGLARAKRALEKQQATLDLNPSEPFENSSLHPIPSHPIPSESDSPVGESSPPGRGKKLPACPYEQITACYAELLPSFPKLVTHPTWRRAAVQARWREDARFQTLDFWKGYFRYVGESDFLAGRAKPFGDRKPFQADFDWITGPKNFHKILSGKYHHD